MDQDEPCSRFWCCNQISSEKVLSSIESKLPVCILVHQLSKKLCVGSGLQKYLNQLGFHIVGYGCTTCIGNSGDIEEAVASAISENGETSSWSESC